MHVCEMFINPIFLSTVLGEKMSVREFGELNVIRFLIRSFYEVQKVRVQTYNNIVAYVQYSGLYDKLKEEAKKIPKVKAEENEEEELADQIQFEEQSQEQGETQINYASPKVNETQTENAEIRPKDVADDLIQGRLKTKDPEINDMIWYYKALRSTEKELGKKLDHWSADHPLRVQYLSKIKGIGPIFSSGIIAYLSPISRFDTISKVWSYCGFSAIHYESECEDGHKIISTSPLTVCPVQIRGEGKGKRKPCGAKIIKSEKVNTPPRRKRGYYVAYNDKLKTFMWKIGVSFLKQNPQRSYYRRLFEEKKKYYTNRPDLAKELKEGKKGAKGHIHAMALHYVIKRFLANLWIKWREIEGLPTRKPYAIEYLGHTTYEPPPVDEP